MIFGRTNTRIGFLPLALLLPLGLAAAQDGPQGTVTPVVLPVTLTFDIPRLALNASSPVVLPLNVESLTVAFVLLLRFRPVALFPNTELLIEMLAVPAVMKELRPLPALLRMLQLSTVSLKLARVVSTEIP